MSMSIFVYIGFGILLVANVYFGYSLLKIMRTNKKTLFYPIGNNNPRPPRRILRYFIVGNILGFGLIALGAAL